MKKSSIGLIMGIIIVLAFLIGIANGLSKPDSVRIINVANLLTNISWITLGVFLIYSHFSTRNKAELSVLNEEVIPDSQEDIELLKNKQLKVLAYVIVAQLLGSIAVYVLNDYTDLTSIINIAVIFDLLINIFYFYCVVCIFSGQDKSKLLFNTTVVYLVGGAVIYFIRQEWYGLIINTIFCLYILYSLRSNINRKNYKIINFVVLPLALVATIALSSFSDGQISNLWKKEVKVDQQVVNLNSDINAVYINITDEQKVAKKVDMQKVLDKLNERDQKFVEIRGLFEQIRKEYANELPSISKIKDYKFIDNLLISMEINQRQSDKIKEFMKYYLTLNPSSISASQREKIDTYIREVEEFNSKLREAALNFNE